MEANGWRRVDFKSDASFMEWVQTRPPSDEYFTRKARLEQQGLACRLAVKWDNHFARVELIPLPGFIHLATEESVRHELASGWRPHISLTKWTGDPEAFNRLVQRWDGVETVLSVDYVTDGAVAVLSWDGLGADPDAWALYLGGEFAYKWEENSFGLHVSL